MSASSSNSNQKKRILVIDDEPMIVDFLKEVFQELALEVDTAANGFEAVKILSARAFDIVTTDLDMPMLTGEGVVDGIRSSPLNYRTPVIVISGNCDETTAKRLMKKGVRAILLKPAPLDEITKTVGDILSEPIAQPYTDEIVRCVREGAAGPICGLLATLLAPTAVTMSVSTKTSCEFTGVVPLFGRELFGYMNVGFDKSLLDHIYGESFAYGQVPTLQQATELARELTNQVGSAVARNLRQLGNDQIVGLPVLQFGADMPSNPLIGGKMARFAIESKHGRSVIEFVFGDFKNMASESAVEPTTMRPVSADFGEAA